MFFVSHGRPLYCSLFYLVYEIRTQILTRRASRNCHSRPLDVVAGAAQSVSGFEVGKYVVCPPVHSVLIRRICTGVASYDVCAPPLFNSSRAGARCARATLASQRQPAAPFVVPAHLWFPPICGASAICGPSVLVEHTAWRITALVPGWKYSSLAVIDHPGQCASAPVRSSPIRGIIAYLGPQRLLEKNDFRRSRAEIQRYRYADPSPLHKPGWF